jgi:Fe-S-cluster containining protein
MIYQEDLNKALAQKKSNKKLVRKLKTMKPNQLDSAFRESHDSVFQEIDCLSCANCCKTTSPIFRDVDIQRLSAHLKMEAQVFIESYLKLDAEGDFVLQQSPCSFLQEDNKCAVYESRPLACREYPHTNRKKMHQILELSRKNTEICPAVARIFSELRHA